MLFRSEHLSRGAGLGISLLGQQHLKQRAHLRQQGPPQGARGLGGLAEGGEGGVEAVGGAEVVGGRWPVGDKHVVVVIGREGEGETGQPRGVFYVGEYVV